MKTLLLFLGISLVTISCGTRDNEKNIAVASLMFEAFNQHDWEKMTSYYSDEALFLDPSYGTEYVTKSRKETAGKYAELQKMFPNIRDHIVGMYPSGDKVTVEFVSSGTLGDTLKFQLPIVTVLTFKAGIIIKDATYYDQENP
jgi:hypothetical protein